MNQIRERVVAAAQTTALAVVACIITVGLVGCASSSGGSSGGTGSGTGALASGGASAVYLIQQPSSGADSLLQFTAGGNGAMSPVASETLPTGFTGQSVAIDSTGKLWVGGYTGTQYEAIATSIGSSGSGGSSGSSQVILLSTNTSYSFDPPVALTTDSSNSLYVLGFAGDLNVFSSTASGQATPTRTISGSLTTLGNYYPEGIALDSAGNIYIAAANTSFVGGAILEFPAGANGNIAPMRTILSSATIPTGVAVDASGNIFVSLNTDSNTPTASIVEYSSSASGTAVPTKTLNPSGTASAEIGSLSIDKVGNLYAIMETLTGSGTSSTGNFSVLGIGPNATGSAIGSQFTSASITTPAVEIAIK